jgi:GR25 family glycosyltransferase involved in LPS biosynthesis
VSISPPDVANVPAREHGLEKKSPWQAFDSIYCISLASRADRYENARIEFQRVGLGNLVNFAIVDKHPTDSERGIFESHMACVRAGLAAGAKKILIFEDDILFYRFSSERLRRAVRFMNSSADWEIFFFGCFVNSSRKTAFRSVVKINYRCTAHGYVLNREFAEKLVEKPWQNIPYDDLLRSLAPDGTYAIYPGFAFQSASATDNDKLRGVDRARRLFGGFRRLQLWNEFSTRRLIPLVIAHAVVFFILLLLILFRYGPLHR